MFIYRKVNDSDFDKVLNIYTDAKWSNYTVNPHILREAHKGSLLVLGAWFEDTLVGLVRIVGDGKTIVYVQDILVLGKYMRKGIGRALMTQIFETYHDVRQIVLITDDEIRTRKFYESFNMKQIASTNGICYVKYQ